MIFVPFCIFFLLYYIMCSSLQYINRDLSEEFYTIDSHSDTLYKKVECIYI